jgi:Ca-activated chloride channel family protein
MKVLQYILVATFIFFVNSLHAQDDKEKQKELRESQQYLSDATEALEDNNFPQAEAEYRKSIAINPANDTGKYNLGNAYYNKDKNGEAMLRFKQAAAVATNKPEKHKAFHNLGNTFMNEKKYKEAVEAYKNALRNNPKDDETRYNLALAKKMLEEENKNGGGDEGDKEQKKQDQNKDDQQNKDNQDQQNEGDQGDKEKKTKNKIKAKRK